MQRLYYICTPDMAKGSVHLFQDSHWIDIGNGLALLSSKFLKETSQDLWESQASVIALPNPLDFGPIDPQTIQLLSSIGANPGQATKDIRKLARRIHPLM